MNALPNELINHGTSVINTFRQIASAFGTAILVTIYSVIMSASLPSMGQVEASIFGFNMAFVVAAGLAFAAFIVTIIFVKGKPAKQTAPDEAKDADAAEDATEAKGADAAEGADEEATTEDTTE